MCLPHPLMEDYKWDLLEDNKTISCGVCVGLNVTGDSHTAADKERSLLGSLLGEDPSCSCVSCLCDVQLADCLKKAGHCAPPLWGIGDFIESQVDSLANTVKNSVTIVGNFLGIK